MLRSDSSAHVERILSGIAGGESGGESGREAAASEAGRDLIAESWARCLQAYGLDPTAAGGLPVLTSGELKERRAPLRELLTIARPELRRLERQVTAAGYVILFTDSQGAALDLIGDAGAEAELKQAGLHPGSLWGERFVGTNGVGTCIATGQPLTVHRRDHFRACYTGLTCTVCPILDPQGRLVAVLDVSAMSAASAEAQALALSLVKQAAARIESAFFIASFRDSWVLRLVPDQAACDPERDGLLAVDAAGAVVAANRSATGLLQAQGRQPVVGARLTELFDAPEDRLLDVGGASLRRGQPVCTRNGAQVCVLALPPEASRLAIPARAKAPAPGRRGCGGLTLDRLAGEDPGLQRDVARIRRVVDAGIPVLLTGETGTGKEVFAKAVHLASRRADKPFVAINCAAIPETLIESELFGYEPGAFTGARKQGMRGKIEEAHGGTLFLDEIGDMPYELQTRLLRVLAEREVTKVGSRTATTVDVNIVCATLHDIRDLVREGRFREDLYYRISGVKLCLPPLRRRADKAALIARVFAMECEAHGREAALSPAARDRLERHDWPGNVRELRHALQVAIALADGGRVEPAHLPEEVLAAPASRAADGLSAGAEPAPVATHPCAARLAKGGCPAPPQRRACEREVLLAALLRHQWCVSRTARELGVSRSTVHRKIKKFALVSPNAAACPDR